MSFLSLRAPRRLQAIASSDDLKRTSECSHFLQRSNVGKNSCAAFWLPSCRLHGTLTARAKLIPPQGIIQSEDGIGLPTRSYWRVCGTYSFFLYSFHLLVPDRLINFCVWCHRVEADRIQKSSCSLRRSQLRDFPDMGVASWPVSISATFHTKARYGIA